jgi:hypothetical protein
MGGSCSTDGRDEKGVHKFWLEKLKGSSSFVRKKYIPPFLSKIGKKLPLCFN